jgi:YidC/Oxa1 family membrane protein insertase
MFSTIWHTVFFDPIYNTLIFFIDVIPRGDVGLAIIATVIVVKMVLLPLSIKAVKTQRVMREIEPKLKEIKEKHKDNREAQARAMMDVYKDAKLNPFASILLMLIQIPLVIALYLAVASGGGVALPSVNVQLLYSFVSEPTIITMNFLQSIDIGERSMMLALAAGVAQFFYTKLSLPTLPPREPDQKPDLKEDFMRNMHLQMRYVMPVIIVVVAYTLSATIALYFLVSNLVSIAQEFYVRRHR